MQFPWKSKKPREAPRMGGTTVPAPAPALAMSGILEVLPPGKSSFVGSVLADPALDLLRKWFENRSESDPQGGMPATMSWAAHLPGKATDLLRDLQNRSKSDPQGGRTNLHRHFKVPGLLSAKWCAEVLPYVRDSFPGGEFLRESDLSSGRANHLGVLSAKGCAGVLPPGNDSISGNSGLTMGRKISSEELTSAISNIQISDIWMALAKLNEQKDAKFCADSNSDSVRVENENSAGYHTSEEKKMPKEGQQSAFCIAGVLNGPKLQAKGANVKSWACANFSSISGVELLRFLHSLSRMCVGIEMDLSLEPTMLVRMSLPCDNIEVGLWSVRQFFGKEMEKGHTNFLLVILPDTRCFDEIVEATCKDIGVVYQCCLPQYDRMENKEYLLNTATEIKAKVTQFNKHSDSLKDIVFVNIFDEEMEDDGYGYEEMREDDDDAGYEEMGDDDGSDYEMRDDDGADYEMRVDDDYYDFSVQVGSPLNESGDYTCEEKSPETSNISGIPDLEMSGQLLFPADTPMTEGESTNIKTWACVNFSRIECKGLLRFLSKLGNMCMSIGMDLSLEPMMLIHQQSTHENDMGDSLWTVFDFFSHLKIKKRETLVLVILPESISDSVRKMCDNLGFVYHLCPSWHAKRQSEKYLKNAANIIKAKARGLSDYCGDMSEDSDAEESDSGSENLGGSSEKTTEDDYNGDEELNYRSGSLETRERSEKLCLSVA